MFPGRLLTESLPVGQDLIVPGMQMTRCGRHNVSASVKRNQPTVWTFVDFEIPDPRANELADDLVGALLPDDGWYADFQSDTEHIVVFSGKSFRYSKGDAAARDQVVEYGRRAGTPEHQLDWEAEDPLPGTPADP